MRNALVFVGLGAIVLIIGGWMLSHRNTVTAENPPSATSTQAVSVKANQGAAIGEENLVTFKCDDDKSIEAVFERDIVALTLSDGRQITLRQAMSGSGIRYLSNDSKIEFRGKGNEGFLSEEGKTTYESCLASQ